ncbi:MAG: EAL and HDOD domain-containing protein [Desulfohalobiaceae bacterium]
MTEENSALEAIYVARQPVFDTKMRVWGQELLFRQSAQSASASVDDGDVATSKVVVDGFGLAMEWLEQKQKALINFPSSMLLQGTPRVLPAEKAVVEILEDVQPKQEILDICKQLKAEGYILALDDFVGNPGYEPLLQMADLVKVDVLQLEPEQLKEISRELSKYQCRLLAEKVEDAESFALCKRLGFQLFQGFFFSRPQILCGRKLSSNQLSKLQLLKELNKPDLDLAQIADIIKGDVSLSYRLLLYINSPAIGLAFRIKSISQAVTLLGQIRIKAWLQVLIMADMATTPCTQELLFFSLQRAWFLEILARKSDKLPMDPDSMFLLGLFSSLDALLSQPMQEILGKLSLQPRIEEALLGRDDGLVPWLDLARASERGHWEQTDAILQAAGIHPSTASLAQNQATAWAKYFLNTT